MRPVRTAAAAILPPEISVIDQETGRLEEQIRQLGRIKNSLKLRDELSEQIDAIDHELNQLEGEIAEANQEISFSQASDVLAEGMNSYLNGLNHDNPNRWPEEPVRVRLDPRRFEFTINDAKWSSKLGATLQAYLLMSYHYALMTLVGKDQYNYPGLLIVDFPPTFADEIKVADQENYIVEPFIRLTQQMQDVSSQMITAGRIFDGLHNVHRIELTKVWK